MFSHLYRLRFLTVSALLVLASCAALISQARAASPSIPPPPVLAIEGLGKGAAPLDGLWQFHLGDDPTFAAADLNDTAGQSGWEQIFADKSWGTQGHPAYTGFAWYRRHVHLTIAPGAEPDIALLIRHIDDVYEIYWNSKLIGRNGSFPPNPSYYFSQGLQTFGMGPVRDGVLAIRVWKAPLISFDSDELGGLRDAPVVGSPNAIAAVKTVFDYGWMRSQQYSFGLLSLYVLVFALSLFAWLRNRSLPVLLWMAVFSFSAPAATFLLGLMLPLSQNFALGWLQPVLGLHDIGLWFLLLYILQLNERPRLARFTRTLAWISITSTCLDGLLTMLDWSNPLITPWAQVTDAILTGIFTMAELYPLVLVILAIRKRLDPARWLVAITAFTAGMISVVRIGLLQGDRFTHWTLGNTLGGPLFTVNGNVFTAQIIAATLLLLAIIYAVYCYQQESSRRQSALEQEFKSARELQQVLIPDTLPQLPGFAVTSAYRPAQEVGGDFFQIIPLTDDRVAPGVASGSTLILLGDVSGKGLKAAMTVSLIVGAVRSLAEQSSSPATILAGLNRRLHGRLQDGFATCIALRLHADGTCTLASAGHPAPFLNERELELSGALPLGLISNATYEESTFQLMEGDRFSLYTDGLLEARSPSGEIFSFDRLEALFATNPNAAQASDAAVAFGQDDDITVLTFTRLRAGQQSTIQLLAPSLAAV